MKYIQADTDRLVPLELQLKSELENLLGRTVHSAGSQLLGLVMLDSDIDVAVSVEEGKDLQEVVNRLASEGYEFEPYTDPVFAGLQFGICCKKVNGVKVDVQLRSKSNIADLENQIAQLPDHSIDALQRLRRTKVMMRAIGGAAYVNWKHDLYRNHLPALLLTSQRRENSEMCQSTNTLLGGQCTKRAVKLRRCKLHADEVMMNE
jgi:hypothetical protein